MSIAETLPSRPAARTLRDATSIPYTVLAISPATYAER